MEIGKGKYDSIGSSLVTIVSPYADTLGYRNSDITVCGNIPYVIMGTSIYDASNCEMFLTHYLSNQNLNLHLSFVEILKYLIDDFL